MTYLSQERKKVQTKLITGPQIDVIIELKQYNILTQLFTCKKMLTLPPGEILYSKILLLNCNKISL